MQISKEWCGFTGGQADTLRKAVGKKKIDLMKKVKPEFVEGAIKVGGATEEIAETFWNQLLEFANYCFNKSHAACYALIAYWTAYLKAHYPDAFMAALMTADMNSTDRLAIEMSECQHMGLKVLGPDINQSYGDFAIVGGENTIRFGLSGVKGMGKSLIEDIVIPERDENGPFKSICDFAKRVDSTKFNKKSWEAAIKTGAFDKFATRSDILFNLEAIQAYGAKIQKDAQNGQTDLFGAFGDAGQIPEVEIKPAPIQASEKEQLLWERELMGLYLSAHPLDKYDTYFAEQTHSYDLINNENDNKIITIGGIISSVRNILTKSNTHMAFVKLENKTSDTEVIVFPDLFSKVGGKIKQDAVIKVRGRINATDRSGRPATEIKIIAEDISVITDEELENYRPTDKKLPGLEATKTQTRSTNVSKARKSTHSTLKPDPKTPKLVVKPDTSRPHPERLYVLLENPDDTEALNKIRHICGEHPGAREIILVLKDGDEKRPLRLPFRIDTNNTLITALQDLLGAEKVKIN